MSINFQDCPCAGKNMSNLAAPWILLTLRKHEGTHGYEIKKIIKGYMQDLNIGLNITGLYRHLNLLEKRGMLSSKWDTPGKGPAKRKYYLTEAGKDCLWQWIQTLSIQVLLMERFFKKAKSAFPSASLPEIQFQSHKEF
jgi:DNA-binding PadR family transcriptional regulator